MATWTGTNPALNTYELFNNWDTADVPDNGTETAVFTGNGAVTDITIGASFSVAGFTFEAGAPPFTLSLTNNSEVEFVGVGIVNNSGLEQILRTFNGIGFRFSDSASAGNVSIHVNAGGNLLFEDTSSADATRIIGFGGGIALSTSDGALGIGSLEGSGIVLSAIGSGS